MTDQETGYPYIFLDGPHERQEVIDAIHAVRDEVIDIVMRMDEADWYEPRYHGWTPAAVLGHLNLVDGLSLLALKLSLLGFAPRVSLQRWNRLNNFTARLFSKRIVPTTIEGIRKKETAIADFILQLPVNRFTREVYYPPYQKPLTVEQGVQALFLHHWQHHLQTMREVEGIEQPPEEQSDNG
jgi:hypothetical protein